MIWLMVELTILNCSTYFSFYTKRKTYIHFGHRWWGHQEQQRPPKRKWPNEIRSAIAHCYFKVTILQKYKVLNEAAISCRFLVNTVYIVNWICVWLLLPIHVRNIFRLSFSLNFPFKLLFLLWKIFVIINSCLERWERNNNNNNNNKETMHCTCVCFSFWFDSCLAGSHCFQSFNMIRCVVVLLLS